MTLDPWKLFKQGFDRWEASTAKLMETWLKSPLLLEPAGGMLSVAMKAKAKSDEAVAKWWAGAGLPTRRDQERMMHAINQLQSRLIDLEEELAQARKE